MRLQVFYEARPQQVQILQASKDFFVFVFVFVLFCFNSLDISANLFVVFPDSTQIAEMIPTYKTYYTSLNSHYVSKLCSCLVMLERKKIIWK